MFKSIGTVNYRNESVVLEVDPEISYYYQWWLQKKNIKFNKPFYSPHITIIRKGELFNDNRKYQDQEIEFLYSSDIKQDETYIWLHVMPNQSLISIRLDNGLDWCYDKLKGHHITLGNFK